MRRVKTTLVCAAISLSKLFSNPKTLIILAVMLIFQYYTFAAIPTIARFYQIPATPWVFSFFMANPSMLIVFGGLCILLYSDAPFMDAYSHFMIARCGRRSFILGQLLYVLAVSLLFTVCMFVLSILFILPVIELSDEWGTLLHTLARSSGTITEQTGASVSFVVGRDLLQRISPIAATGMSLLSMWLVSAFLGMVMSFFNVIVGKMSGIIAAGVLVCISYFTAFFGSITIGRWLLYISPVSWSSIGALDWFYSGLLPSPAYAVVVLLAGIIVLGLGSAIMFCRHDLD